MEEEENTRSPLIGKTANPQNEAREGSEQKRAGGEDESQELDFTVAGTASLE